MMFVSCLVLVWLFGGQPLKKVEPIPTDGLIEAMQPLSKTLMESDADETDFVSMDHIAENGEKAVPPQPIPVNKPAKKEILIFVGKTCPPCEKWKRVEMQKFIDAGWSVGIVEVHRYPVTPRFEVTSSETVEHVGYLTFEQAKGLLK